MKPNENPEFLAVFDLQKMQGKTPSLPHVDETLDRLKSAINENALSVVLKAHGYTLTAQDHGCVSDNTKSQIRALCVAMLECLDRK